MEEKEIKLKENQFLKIRTIFNGTLFFYHCNNTKFKILKNDNFTILEITVLNKLLATIQIKNYEIIPG